jgi:hypothetical protein
MNPDDYQKLLRQQEELVRQFTQQAQNSNNGMIGGPMGFWTDIMMWFLLHPLAAWIVVLGIISVWMYSIWHCLRNQHGIDRLTWLVVILAVPVFGVVFYWTMGVSVTVHQSGHRIYQGNLAPPPEPKSGANIASDVNASIAEAVRLRREKK